MTQSQPVPPTDQLARFAAHLPQAFAASQPAFDRLRELRRSGETFAFHARLAAVAVARLKPLALPEFSTREDRLRLCRELLRSLGLDEVCVTVPDPVLSRLSIRVALPSRTAWVLHQPGSRDEELDEAAQADDAALDRMVRILAVAFQNYRGRGRFVVVEKGPCQALSADRQV